MMDDFLGGLGGLLKTFKPIMDATGVKQDDSFSLITLQSEIGDIRKKVTEIYAGIGEQIYVMTLHGQGEFPQFSSNFNEINSWLNLIKEKEAQATKLQNELEQKKNAEEQARRAYTCPNCCCENTEGTKFCQECGAKLGENKPNLCSSCGSQHAPGTKFCTTCGNKL